MSKISILFFSIFILLISNYIFCSEIKISFYSFFNDRKIFWTSNFSSDLLSDEFISNVSRKKNKTQRNKKNKIQRNIESLVSNCEYTIKDNGFYKWRRACKDAITIINQNDPKKIYNLDALLLMLTSLENVKYNLINVFNKQTRNRIFETIDDLNNNQIDDFI